jgi:hypothetical protein
MFMSESAHNYGTNEEAGNIQVCLICSDLAEHEQEYTVKSNGMPTLAGATAMFNALEKADMPQD